MRSVQRREWLDLATGLAGIALMVFALPRLGVTNSTAVALSLLVVVLWIATASTLPIVVVCSITAALVLNFFFMPPLGTLTLTDPQNWVALAVFLVVGFVARQLTASAQARTREALAERREAETVRQKADLAATILASLGHDLRTPLTSLGVAVENLRNAQLTAEARAEQGRVASAEVERLTRLLRDILEMARIDAAALTVARDWVSPADIIDAALAGLRPTLDDRTVDIDAESAAIVFVDPLLTSGALSHLIENAAQYSPVERPVELRGFVDAAGLHLTVRDHGAGLEPDEIGRVFERFFRGQAARRHSPGAGIGLAIAQGLIGVQGGRISAENAVGRGAQFELFIPGESHAAPAADL